MPPKGRKPSWQYWRKLAERWHWKDRADAWDEWRNALAQKHADERAAEAAIREAEEIEKERQRQIEAGRKAVAAGSAVVRRLVALFDEGKLDDLSLERIKTVIVGEGGARAESERKSLVELLPAALVALAEGQKLQRVAQERVTEKREVKIDFGDVDKFADLITKLLPEEKWDEAKGMFAEMLRGEHGNGDTR
ncbi:MAG: hypothetical protein ABIH03_08145 [Pseudomonadota bacterium]